MATVFLPTGRKSYSARVKLWNAKANALEWKKISTGVRDEDSAIAIATALEKASGVARKGGMTKEAAEGLVNTVLDLADVPFRVGVPTLRKFAEALLDGRVKNVEEKTGNKYLSHWDRLKTWAGGKIEWPLDHWNASSLGEYYQDLQTKVSAGTSNDHMRTISMIFESAKDSGFIRGNPAKVVERLDNDTEEKVVITRGETAQLLRAMRKARRRDWCALVLLGWHTGHRIQDLLSRETGDFSEVEGAGWCVQFLPKKTKKKGRTIILPVPTYVALMVRRLGGFATMENADNYNGRVSNQFVEWLVKAGVDPMAVKKKSRTVHLKTFHSFRHAMSTRLTAAGVSGELSRMVTAHKSAKAQKVYIHSEVVALAEALKKVRRR